MDKETSPLDMACRVVAMFALFILMIAGAVTLNWFIERAATGLSRLDALEQRFEELEGE